MSNDGRTDEQRYRAGVPLDVELGPMPGAVALLRAQLKKAMGELGASNRAMTAYERQLRDATAERDVWRDSCDELMDAIERLGGSTE